MSKFSDERLHRAVDDAAAALDQRLAKLNQVSGDIKALEKHLEASGVRDRIEFKFGGGSYAIGDPAEAQETGGGPAEEVIESIVWEQVATHDRWRIMYLKTQRDGCWDEVIPGLFSFDGEPKVTDHRPLIESPAEVRLRVAESHPDFVTAIAEKATPRQTLN